MDHVLIDKRRHSNILDVRSFREADCDTDHCLVVANLDRECQGVSEQLRSLMWWKNWCGKGFAASENLDGIVDISRTWQVIGENIKISATGSLKLLDLKHHNHKL